MSSTMLDAVKAYNAADAAWREAATLYLHGTDENGGWMSPEEARQANNAAQRAASIREAAYQAMLRAARDEQEDAEADRHDAEAGHLV